MIIHAYPPNYNRIKNTFILHKGIVFTYGKNIYNPDRMPIDAALKVHELTHTKQQGDNPGVWWDKYLKDPLFRYEQELQAYKRQYNFFKIKHSNKQVEMFLDRIAHDLASDMYGNIIEFQDAKILIAS